ncbi:MAG: cellulase family glycosylhydrolase [Anaerolineae bacterium]|jgi:endoglycosylceramidase|nr:cellulase family glycosylhydrolase [Anaerolineae bacterium]
MAKNPLVIKDNRFFDAYGRQVILHGINLVDINPKSNYMAYCDPAIFRQFREWGFNCIRLGILWDGLEPQPAILNEEYLKGIDRMLDHAHQNGLYVLLEMHQALYASKFSAGAPNWATITHAKPHYDVSEVWRDMYFTSPAVEATLDNFWDNVPALDRVGLQDHFGAVWGKVARRYCHHPAVIGYDLFNDPMPGRLATHAQVVMLTKGVELLVESGLLNEYMSKQPEGTDLVEALLHYWLSEEGRRHVLTLMKDINLYQSMIDVQEGFYQQFEKEKWMPMVQRIARIIRKVDPTRFLFLETAMVSNMGVRTAIEPIHTEQGGVDPNLVYAPHGTDPAIDLADLNAASPERMELIFNRHQESARRLNMPMLVGEWGAFGKLQDALPSAWQVVGLFEELQCSDTYWTYFEDIANTASFPAIQRPYPMKINGRLTSYHYDPEEEKFSFRWMEYGNSTQPTYIYLPDWFDAGMRKVHLSSEAAYQVHPVTRGSKNTILSIPPTGKTNARWLTVN